MTDEKQLRSDAVSTRRKLVEVGLEHFGRFGFEAASTRALADAAGVNLAAIKYHFASKEGLYLAVAEHIATEIATVIGSQAEQIQESLGADEKPPTPEQARAMLRQLASRMIFIMATNPQTALWMRYILREQAEPTQAFDIIYGKVMRRLHELATRLIAAITNDDPESDTARLIAFSLVGQVIVFRVARAAVLRRMQWQDITPVEAEQIRNVIFRFIDALQPAAPDNDTQVQ